jgi:hypothetical protein
VIGGLQDDDGEADIGAVLGGDALDQRALVALRSRRGVAADLPVAMHRFDRALAGSGAGGEHREGHKAIEGKNCVIGKNWVIKKAHRLKVPERPQRTPTPA